MGQAVIFSHTSLILMKASGTDLSWARSDGPRGRWRSRRPCTRGPRSASASACGGWWCRCRSAHAAVWARVWTRCRTGPPAASPDRTSCTPWSSGWAAGPAGESWSWGSYQRRRAERKRDLCTRQQPRSGQEEPWADPLHTENTSNTDLIHLNLSFYTLTSCYKRHVTQ